MKIQTLEIGNQRNTILIIDDFHPNPEEIIEFANSFAPFPNEEKSLYPGVRLRFNENNSYIEYIDKAIKPIIMEIYGLELKLDLASFSMVAKQKEELNILQRIPHFDSLSPNYFAFLHYLFRFNYGGTSFYRHKDTGIEMVSENNISQYIESAKSNFIKYGEPEPKFITDSNDMYERIYTIEAKFNRVAFYSGAILHSGNIAPDINFSLKPSLGRLTGNVFYNGF